MIEIREPTKKDSVILWLMDNKKQLWTLFAVVLVGLIALFYVGAAQAKAKRESIAKTAGLYLKWQGGDSGAYEALSKILKKNPGMSQKYNSLIAQTLLNRDEIEAALPMAKKSIAGLQLGQQKIFSRGSLLIANGELKQALKEAKEAKFEDELISLYNMLRIAVLEEKIGTPAGELAAWDALERSGMEAIQGNFREGNLSLVDFINYRRAALK